MKKFIKRIFGKKHNYTITNKFNIGDVCMWPGYPDSCDDAVVEITNYSKDYDDETNEEFILYEFTDIYRNIDYSDVKESELYRLATKDEIEECKSII